MPKIVDKESKSLELIEAATAVFARDGFANTKIADIAEYAGVGKGTVYEYFPSKTDLFWAVCENLVHCPDDVASFTADPEKGFPALIAALVDSYEASNAFFLVLVDYWAAIIREKNRSHELFLERAEQLYAAPRSLIMAVVQAGQRKGVFSPSVDAAVIAAITIAGIEGLRTQKLQDPRHVDFQKCIRELTDMLLTKLKADQGSASIR